jgi:hypothetical protein
MPRYQVYECDVCTGKFRYMHHPNDAPPPDTCPLCGSPNDPSPSFIPQAPAIKGIAAAAGDQVYRSMENASIARTEMMAEYGGGSASDYSHTKITDLKDNQREGDLAYKMPPNEVQNFMRQNPNVTGGASQHVAFAQAKAAEAHTGYFPHAGRRTGEVIGNVHGQIAGRMRSLGQMNGNSK